MFNTYALNETSIAHSGRNANGQSHDTWASRRDRAWLIRGARPAWIAAVTADRELPAGAARMGARLHSRCLHSPHWCITPVALGAECNYRRSQSYELFAALERRRYVRRTATGIELIPLSLRGEQQPDLAPLPFGPMPACKPPVDKPAAPPDASAAPDAGRRAHKQTRVSKSVGKAHRKPTAVTAAPGSAFAAYDATPDTAAGPAGEIAQTLEARGVARYRAAAIAAAAIGRYAALALATVAYVVRHIDRKRSAQPGMYVAALSNPEQWTDAYPPPDWTPAAAPVCKLCGEPLTNGHIEYQCPTCRAKVLNSPNGAENAPNTENENERSYVTTEPETDALTARLHHENGSAETHRKEPQTLRTGDQSPQRTDNLRPGCRPAPDTDVSGIGNQSTTEIAGVNDSGRPDASARGAGYTRGVDSSTARAERATRGAAGDRGRPDAAAGDNSGHCSKATPHDDGSAPVRMAPCHVARAETARESPRHPLRPQRPRVPILSRCTTADIRRLFDSGGFDT